MNKKSIFLFVWLPLACAAIPLVCIPAAEWLVVSGYGYEALLWQVIFLIIPALLAVPVFLAALIGLGFKRTRFISSVCALCSATYLVAFIISLPIGEKIRMRGFHRLAERSKPLVDAVRAYEDKHGRPPASLEALVPEFIASIPSTGMKAYPKYEYSVVTNANVHGNPWIITIFTPSGGINFDQFMYWPLTNYPARGYGGWIERVGDWAYVHE
jgi:hypothetical protein